MSEKEIEYPIGITSVPHPFQPLYLTDDTDKAVLRFKKNHIIDYLFNTGKLDLNAIMGMGFPQEDYEQLAQLLGYSHSGYGDLSYVRNETWYGAKNAANGDSTLLARYNALSNELKEIKEKLKKFNDEIECIISHD